MTTKQLSNLKNLKAEIKMYEEMIGKLKALPKSIPYQNGYSIAKIIDTKDKLSKNYSEMIHYIENVDDPIISIILKYKYISNFSWQKIALKIGGSNKADSLKKRLYRYLKKQENSCSYTSNKGDLCNGWNI